jgi:hypothetical protein
MTSRCTWLQHWVRHLSLTGASRMAGHSTLQVSGRCSGNAAALNHGCLGRGQYLAGSHGLSNLLDLCLDAQCGKHTDSACI